MRAPTTRSRFGCRSRQPSSRTLRRSRGTAPRTEPVADGSEGPSQGGASPVLAIAGAHLVSVPRSRARPVGAAQCDRVPEMASGRLVASARMRPIVKLPVPALCRRHLRPYPCRSSFEIRSGSLPPSSGLRAHNEPRRGTHAGCPGQGFRCPLWSYGSEPRTGPSSPRRCMRPQGHVRVEGSIGATEGGSHWWNRKQAQRKLFSVEWWQAFTAAP